MSRKREGADYRTKRRQAAQHCGLPYRIAGRERWQQLPGKRPAEDLEASPQVAGDGEGGVES